MLDEKDRSLLNTDNEIEQLEIKNIEQKEFSSTENERQKDLHAKEHEILNVNLHKDKELEKIELEKVLAKYDFDEKVKSERFDKDCKALIEEEAIEHHQKEFERQSSVASEFKEFQDEFSNLYSARSKELSEYEELETTNRYKLKVKFLEKQLELVQKDASKALSKVNQRFDEEIQNYSLQIEAGSSGELEELVAYEAEKNAEIEKDVEKRNTLDAKAYKKQIRDLDHKIDQMRKQLSHEVDERKQELESSIQIFKDETVHAESRKDIAISEIEGFLDGEVSRLNSAIELLNQQLNAELLDISKRKDSTTDNSKLFDSQSKIRREKAHLENENYMAFRTKEQRDNIHKLEYAFEEKRNEYDNEYQEALELLKNNRDFIINDVNEKLSAINDGINGIEQEATSKNEETTNSRRKKEQALQESNLKNSGRLDLQDRNHRTSITNAMYERNTV